MLGDAVGAGLEQQRVALRPELVETCWRRSRRRSPGSARRHARVEDLHVRPEVGRGRRPIVTRRCGGGAGDRERAAEDEQRENRKADEPSRRTHDGTCVEIRRHCGSFVSNSWTGERVTRGGGPALRFPRVEASHLCGARGGVTSCEKSASTVPGPCPKGTPPVPGRVPGTNCGPKASLPAQSGNRWVSVPGRVPGTLAAPGCREGG